MDNVSANSCTHCCEMSSKLEKVELYEKKRQISIYYD